MRTIRAWLNPNYPYLTGCENYRKLFLDLNNEITSNRLKW
jgi:hypothetical protein